MADIVTFLCLIAAVLLPFVAMPLLWRRMKRTRDATYRDRPEPQREQPWEETIERTATGDLKRVSKPNDELIAMGERENSNRWPLDNS